MAEYYSNEQLYIILSIALGGALLALIMVIGDIILFNSTINNRLEEIVDCLTMTKLTAANKKLYLGSESKGQKNLWLRKLEQFIQATVFLERDKLTLRLEHAGFSFAHASLIFAWAKVSVFAIGLIAIVLLFYTTFIANMLLAAKCLIISIILIFSWFAVDIFLTIKTKRRFRQIQKYFPNVIDLIIISTGAGHGFNVCIERVAREIKVFNKEIAKELSLFSLELKFFLDAREALFNLNRRLPLPIVKNFTTTIIQSMQHGTSILQSLQLLAKETRLQALHAAENKAGKLPNLILLPLVLLTLPSLLILILGPSIVKIADSFTFSTQQSHHS